MTDESIFYTVVLGVATAVAATIIVNKYFSGVGTGTTVEPQQGLQVQVPCVTSPMAAPVPQNTPITEAAYNVGVGSDWSSGDDHLWNAAAFGYDQGDPSQEVTLPQ
jgi:hypothetical protein